MKYLVRQMMQMSFWFGASVILAALFATRGEIATLGVVMMLARDQFIKNQISEYAPRFVKWAERMAGEL